MNQPARIAIAATVRVGWLFAFATALVAGVEGAAWLAMWLDSRREQ